ncbi:MAG: methyltransferase domain-containing protein [Pseudomonadota bacterium]
MAGKKRSVAHQLYPETNAGGFSRIDQRVNFYVRVAALLEDDHVVVDFGAGRDKFEGKERGFKRFLTRSPSRVGKLIAVDVDPAVMTHPYADEKYVIDETGRLPLPDESVDVIVAYAVFEHIENPKQAIREMERVLKPGGWICAWTPNKWSYQAIGARIVPNRFHARVLDYVGKGMREDEDVFPTFYRMNTLGDLKRLFPRSRFNNYSFCLNGGGGYNFGQVWMGRVWQFWNWMMPPNLRQFVHVFVQKQPQTTN